jgi:hypothetical protein
MPPKRTVTRRGSRRGRPCRSRPRRAEGGLDGIEVAGLGGGVELGHLGLHLLAAALNLAPSARLGLGALLGALVGAFAEGGEWAAWTRPSRRPCWPAATLASKGTRPLAMAPMRPKWAAITVKAPWRYLMASSGFWNWAAAGRAAARPATVAIARRRRFIREVLRCLEGGERTGTTRGPGLPAPDGQAVYGTGGRHSIGSAGSAAEGRAPIARAGSLRVWLRLSRPRTARPRCPCPTAPTPLTAVRVWDLPTRLFHWLLAAAVIGSVVTARSAATPWSGTSGSATWCWRCWCSACCGAWSAAAGRASCSFVYAPGTCCATCAGRAPRRAPRRRATARWAPLGVRAAAAAGGAGRTGLVADDEIANIGPLNRFVSGDTAARPRPGTRTGASGSCSRWWRCTWRPSCSTAWPRPQPGAPHDQRRQAAARRHAGQPVTAAQRGCWRWCCWPLRGGRWRWVVRLGG